MSFSEDLKKINNFLNKFSINKIALTWNAFEAVRIASHLHQASIDSPELIEFVWKENYILFKILNNIPKKSNKSNI